MTKINHECNNTAPGNKMASARVGLDDDTAVWQNYFSIEGMIIIDHHARYNSRPQQSLTSGVR